MNQVVLRRGGWVAMMLCLLGAAVIAQAASPPEVVRSAKAEGANLYLTDGVVKKIYLTQDDYGAAVTSTDGGETFERPGEPVKRWATKVLLDRDGEMHGFFLMLRVVNEGGRRVAIDRFIDVLHVKTTGGGQRWEKVKTIQEGWNGSIVSAPLQLPSGRIVLPSQDWVPGSRSVPPTGNGYAMTMYSDDGGDTWSRSNRVVSPVYEGYNGANFGACEPSIVQLDDGRLWMLMRTQTGWLYQAFSSDGAVWSQRCLTVSMGRGCTRAGMYCTGRFQKMTARRGRVFARCCAIRNATSRLRRRATAGQPIHTRWWRRISSMRWSRQGRAAGVW